MEKYIMVAIFFLSIVGIIYIILHSIIKTSRSTNKEHDTQNKKQKGKKLFNCYFPTSWSEEKRWEWFVKRNGPTEEWGTDEWMEWHEITTGRDGETGEKIIWRGEYETDEEFQRAVAEDEEREKRRQEFYAAERAEEERKREAREKEETEQAAWEVERRKLYEEMKKNMIDEGWAADCERRRSRGQLTLTRTEFLKELVTMRKNEETGILESSLVYEHEASRFAAEGFPNPWELFRTSAHEELARQEKIKDAEALAEAREIRKAANPDVDAEKIKAIIATRKKKKQEEAARKEGEETQEEEDNE